MDYHNFTITQNGSLEILPSPTSSHTDFDFILANGISKIENSMND
jgi:hypothetical protein